MMLNAQVNMHLLNLHVFESKLQNSYVNGIMDLAHPLPLNQQIYAIHMLQMYIPHKYVLPY